MSTARRQSLANRGTGPNGRNLCYCGCGREVQGRRVNWFSDECVNNWSLRNDPGIQRRAVEHRDKEVCAVCGLDCRALEKRLRDLRDRLRGRPFARVVSAVTRLLKALPDGWGREIRPDHWGPHWRHLWEMDHIVPVVEGGGGCDLTNLRTLCIVCHKAATRALARRRSRAARIDPQQPTLLDAPTGGAIQQTPC